MKRAILNLKNKEDGSSFYRLYQYVGSTNCRIVNGTSDRIYRWYYDGNHVKGNFFKRLVMAGENLIRITFVLVWDKLVWRSKKVIINRRLFPRKLPFYGERLLRWYFRGKEVYWDFDDNIILDGEITRKEADILEKTSKKIIVTNEFLENTIHEEHRWKVELLPTTDVAMEKYEQQKVTEKRLNSYNNEIKLVWLGTRNNLIYLTRIIPQLEHCARALKSCGKQLKLMVICNQRLEVSTSDVIVENIVWTREDGLKKLSEAHIGLMPLENTEYTKGKGGFKAVQYIGMGLPSIASNVGYNSHVIMTGYNGYLCNRDEDWYQYILELAINEKLWNDFSYHARQSWEKMFDAKFQQKFWKEIIQ